MELSLAYWDRKVVCGAGPFGWIWKPASSSPTTPTPPDPTARPHPSLAGEAILWSRVLLAEASVGADLVCGGGQALCAEVEIHPRKRFKKCSVPTAGRTPIS